MLTAFLSDVHGNLIALEAVMNRVRELSPDRVVFLGDVVGYGPWPSECLDIIMEVSDFAVLGNHDAGVCGRLDVSGYYDAVRYVIEWTKGELSDKHFHYLEELPLLVRNEDEGWLASHGSPVNPEQFRYLFDSSHVSALAKARASLEHLSFSGHSHTMQFFILNEAGGAIELDSGKGFFDASAPFNVVCVTGSVGQPRDGDARAGFVTYDTDDRLVRFYRVPYDKKRVVDRMEECKLPRSFAERLLRGV